MKHHILKTDRVPFNLIERGIKTFELRVNDRDFAIGDVLHLCECIEGAPTGRELPGLKIRFVLYGGVYGLPSGYCIMNW